MSLKRRIGLMCVMSLLAQLACADFSNEISESSAPIGEGVPEVALVRLQALLNNNLPEAEWRAVVEKLAEAQIAAKQPENALVLLADSRVRELSWAKFWRAQAFASLDRWGEALPLYEQLANEEGSRFRTAAIFGTAEMLRALGRRDEALKKFTPLIHAEHANSAESINHAARYIRCSVDFRRIEMLVQKLAKLGKSSVQFDLLRCRDARIRHYPIGNEMALEKTFGKPERLRTCKKQFLILLNFLLSLRVELIHSGCLRKNWRRIVAMRARVSNHAAHIESRNRSNP